MCGAGWGYERKINLKASRRDAANEKKWKMVRFHDFGKQERRKGPKTQEKKTNIKTARGGSLRYMMHCVADFAEAANGFRGLREVPEAIGPWFGMPRCAGAGLGARPFTQRRTFLHHNKKKQKVQNATTEK